MGDRYVLGFAPGLRSLQSLCKSSASDETINRGSPCALKSGFQARSKDREILEGGGGAGPSTLPRRDHE